MARYIDADALIQHIKDVPTWREMLGVGWRSTRYPDGMYDCNDIINSIENASTADVVEVRRGKWIKHKPDSEYIKGLHQLGIAKGMGENSIYWTCSECEHWGVLHYKYCPNCGAKMDKEVTE